MNYATQHLRHRLAYMFFWWICARLCLQPCKPCGVDPVDCYILPTLINMFFPNTYSAIQAQNAQSHTSIDSMLTFLQADIMTTFKYDSYTFTVTKRLQRHIYTSQNVPF